MSATGTGLEAVADPAEDADSPPLGEPPAGQAPSFSPEPGPDRDVDAVDEDEEPTASGLEGPPKPRPITTPPIGEDTVFTGPLLKQLREARSISLKEIADRTRIGAQSLKAVEEERYERLPDAKIYVRGFVRCLAKEIGLDPERVAKTYLARWDEWYESQKGKKKQYIR